ncbi:MAG: WGR domain-containing protein [Rhodobacteraceae bacterium]|nr:WGR domain-containing protein [Paracoccaceae bacterium]
MSQSVHLLRYDPARNMARFYSLELCRTLFGEVVLIRRWGRIGTKGRWQETVLVQQSEGEVMLRIWQQRKERRGYRPA